MSDGYHVDTSASEFLRRMDICVCIMLELYLCWRLKVSIVGNVEDLTMWDGRVGGWCVDILGFHHLHGIPWDGRFGCGRDLGMIMKPLD